MELKQKATSIATKHISEDVACEDPGYADQYPQKRLLTHKMLNKKVSLITLCVRGATKTEGHGVIGANIVAS